MPKVVFLSTGRKQRLDRTSAEWRQFRVSGASRAEETQRQRPHPTLSHWVYLRLNKRQLAGSEAGEGSRAEKQFGGHVRLDHTSCC